jgi:allantoin racemase
MKILVLNPNTTEAITTRLVDVGRDAAAPGTQLVPATAPSGFPYISSRAEAQVAGAIVLAMLAERAGTYDAAIIAAFGDPGLIAARELFDGPVIGMSEAAMLTACMLGRRFGIVTFSANLEPWYRECVEAHGLAGRLAGIRCAGGNFTSITDVQHEKEQALVALAQQAVAEDGADVIILAGAPLAGLAARVRDRIPVPLVDQIAAAVKQAEAIVTLSPGIATAGTFRRPEPKSSSGLSPALAARFDHRG